MMNQNLLYLVARHNVERIYGDRRFDWIDDDFIKAVVAVAKELPGGENIVTFPSTTRKKNDTYKKMREMAARTRKRRVR
jgi:hypothetical protein